MRVYWKVKNDPRVGKRFCPACGTTLVHNLIPAFKEESWRCRNCGWEVIARHPFPRVSEDIVSCYEYPWLIKDNGKTGWISPEVEA
jgi:hypothetical protein